MFQIRVLVKKLRCLDCQEKHGIPDATFERGPNANIYDPKSLVCPRCGGKNTLPEVDLQVTDATQKPTGPTVAGA
ncbi:MAG: hypothetical protein FD180_146 [Planctomycetota bacterium]|nr:MAG: hypothetical protein FD180_146 [Planctomycetota bacterium]